MGNVNKIVFEAEFDGSGVSRGLALMEARAAAASGRMNKTLYESRNQPLSKSQLAIRAAYEESQAKKAAGAEEYAEQQKLAAAQLALDAEKRASNLALIQSEIAAERELGIARQMEMDAELAKRAELAAAATALDAEKRASNSAIMSSIVAEERDAAIMADLKAASEAKAAQLASMSWIRSLREVRAARKAALMEEIMDVARRGGVQGRNLDGSHGRTGISGIIGESFVILREIGRGNFARVPGSITILAQRMGLLGLVIKSTAAEAIVASAKHDSLAASLSRQADVAIATAARSKEAGLASAAADTIAAEAAIKRAQAQIKVAKTAKEAAEIQEAGAVVSIGPIGWVTAAVIALGVAAYFTLKHFQALADSERTLKEITEGTRISMVDSTNAMLKAAEAAEAYRDSIDRITKSHETLGETLEKGMALLQERHQLERELAQAKGTSQKDLAALEIKQLEEELAQEKKNAESLAKKAKLSRGESDFRAEQANNPELQTKLDDLQKRAKESEELFRAAEKKVYESDEFKRLEKLKKEKGGAFEVEHNEVIGMATTEGYAQPIIRTTKETVDQAIQRLLSEKSFISGGEKTGIFTSANAESGRFQKLSQEAADLATSMKNLKDMADDAKKGFEVDEKDRQKTEDRIKQLTGSLALKKEFLPQIADASRPGSIGKANDSLVAVGNFLGSSKGKIESLAQKQVHLLTKIEQHLNPANRRRLAGDSFDPNYPVA